MQEIKFGDVSATAWWSTTARRGTSPEDIANCIPVELWREMTRTWDHPIAVRRAASATSAPPCMASQAARCL
jgi:hypothetical protein